MKFDGKFLGVARYSMTTVFFIRKDIMEAKGLKPPKVYDPDVDRVREEDAGRLARTSGGSARR